MTTKQKYKTAPEVVVVGAGPAGCSAALELSNLGVSVLLIDKERFPREKVCGGGLSIRVLDEFAGLFLNSSNLPINCIDSVYLESPSGFHVSYQSPKPIYVMIDRSSLDSYLISLCRKHDLIEVLEGCKVHGFDRDDKAISLDTSKSTIRTQIVIAADGVNSIFARKSLNLDSQRYLTRAFALRDKLPIDVLMPRHKNTMYVYYGYGNSVGYAYLFPHKDHVNLGVGFTFAYIKKNNISLPQELRRFIDLLKLRRILSESAKICNPRGGYLPTAGPLPKTYSDRIVLCGDAGGFVNSFTAEGIYYALASGKHAAHMAKEAIERGRFDEKLLASYQNAWSAKIGKELNDAVKIHHKLFSEPKYIDWVVKAASANKRLLLDFTRFSLGEMGFDEFKRAHRLRLPVFMLLGSVFGSRNVK